MLGSKLCLVTVIAVSATLACGKSKRARCESGVEQMKEVMGAFAKAFIKDEAEAKKKLDELNAQFDAKKKEFLDLCETLPEEAVACLADVRKAMTDEKCQETLAKLDPDKTGHKSKAKGPSPLAKATNGSWSGPYGTLAFASDGSGVFTLKNCGYSLGEPGTIEMSTACDASETRGKVKVEDNSICLMDEAKHMGTCFSGYLDGSGALHLGVGQVAAFDKSKKGDVDIMGATLHVGDSCELEDRIKDEKKPVSCSWAEKSGKKLLVFEQPNSFDKAKMDQRWLVWVEDQELLVEPSVDAMVFKKQ